MTPNTRSGPPPPPVQSGATTTDSSLTSLLTAGGLGSKCWKDGEMLLLPEPAKSLKASCRKDAGWGEGRCRANAIVRRLCTKREGDLYASAWTGGFGQYESGSAGRRCGLGVHDTTEVV
ncbi:hypothetical protein L202_01801 [Cryptococcus amylolentus CBS 6039]|uniref:Uncharacterized protein n=2 Tax=Cryptococcus amylolentus TaxID=104669 RepID=A0A1E3I798_9TREE|nr:hypothetical protein L202_01801 [Cryptococcus amylolentus CBS 6039]ODN83706.1 hypothetical protein L202_01801 [Cryptococcus amylolentus CBS 6039]ODO11178.1 hypothetical protein I350_01782 [Cryptococcus amylolentus CBS 6273]